MSLRDVKRRATASYAAASMIEPATMILLMLFDADAPSGIELLVVIETP